VSSTDETDRHDITEILLRVALNTIKHTNNQTIDKYEFATRDQMPTYCECAVISDFVNLYVKRPIFAVDNNKFANHRFSTKLQKTYLK
jgi:hypothetical protein